MNAISAHAADPGLSMPTKVPMNSSMSSTGSSILASFNEETRPNSLRKPIKVESHSSGANVEACGSKHVAMFLALRADCSEQASGEERENVPQMMSNKFDDSMNEGLQKFCSMIAIVTEHIYIRKPLFTKSNAKIAV